MEDGDGDRQAAQGRQQELFVAASEIRVLGNPFYRALDSCWRSTVSTILRKRRAASSMRRSGAGRAFRPGCIFGC